MLLQIDIVFKYTENAKWELNHVFIWNIDLFKSFGIPI